MNTFLRGTLGKLLQLVFTVLGVILVSMGLFSCAGGQSTGTTILGWFLFILGIVSFGAVFGVRYWLGHVVKME